MHLVWNNSLLWFFAAFLLPLGVGLLALRARRSLAEVEFGRLMSWQSLWVLGQGFELAASDLTLKLVLDGLQYIPMMVSAAVFVRFAHRFAGLPIPRQLLLAALLSAGPLVLFYVTAPLHRLVRHEAVIVPGTPFETLTYPFTPGDDLLVLLYMFLNVYSTVVMLRSALRAHRAQLLAALPILLGSSLPAIASVPGVFLNLRVLGQRDISFVVIGTGGAMVLWGLRRRQSVVTVPVARDLLFERSPDPALVLGDGDRILEFNEAAQRLLFSGEKDAYLGMSLSDVPCTIMDLRRVGAVLEGTSSLTIPTKTGRWYRADHHELPDLGAHLLLLRDVTEEETLARLQREEQNRLELAVELRTQELTASRRRFRVLFDLSSQLTGLLTPSGTLLEANATALGMVGVELHEVQGRPFWDTPWWRHSSELQARVRDAITRAAMGNTVRFEATHLGTAGELRTIDFSVKPVLDELNQVTLLIPEGRDITDLRQAEEQLRQALKMESLGRLAGGIAHDFNNLLTIILGNITLAQEEANPTLSSELLNEAIRAAEHAATLTGQMLAFGRKTLLKPRVLDVASSMSNALTMLRRTIREDIGLQVDLEPNLAPIVFDDTQLHQILFNLVINARDALPEGGLITITGRNVRAPQGALTTVEHVLIEVSDNGCGMSHATQERIFEPFFTTKGPGLGTGLGLSMVYGAMLQQNGRVEVNSTLGEGTRMSLWFRAATEHPEPSCEGERVILRGQGTQIYLIEDEAPVRLVIARQLTQAGFDVRAFDGSHAFIEQISGLTRPSLVITDAIMPRISGHEVLRASRTKWPDIPVLIISGYSEDQELRSAIAEGGHFLNKPFTNQQLLVAVERCLGG